MILIRVHSAHGSRTMLAAACLFGLLGTTAGSRAIADDAIWLGGSGSWSSAGRWSTGQVPGNAFTNVLIDNGNAMASNVSLDINANISGLTIDAGDQLGISNNQALTISGASIVNNGILSINGNGNPTGLVIASGSTVTLTGNGTIALSNDTGSRLFANGSGTLINAGNTIQGSGLLGFGQTTIVNQATGIINANQGVPLVLDADSGGITNQGLLEATNGGTLTIQDSSITNTGGSILSSGAGSTVNLTGVSIQNGTLNTTGGGVLQTTGDAVLDSVTLNGRLGVSNNTGVTLRNTLVNNGTIALNANGNPTGLIVGSGSTVTLTGGGTIAMSNDTGGRIYAASGSAADTFTNVNNIIQGSGLIGLGQTKIINQAAGIINANLPVGIVLSSGSNGVVNQGMLEATNGGTLTLLDSTITNTGGSILSSGAGSKVNLSGVSIQNGTLNTAGGGVLQTTGSATLDTVTLNGRLDVSNNTAVTLRNTLVNNGTIALNANGNLTDLIVASGSTATLTGGGVVTFSNDTGNRIFSASGAVADTFTNVNNTIQGSGQIGAGQTTIINQAAGVINANQSVGIVLHSGSGGVTNQGLLEATSGSTLTLLDSTITNTGGTILAGNNSTVNINGATLVGGTLATSGTGIIQSLGAGTLDSVTSTGMVQINNNTSLDLRNTITNSGQILVNANGNFTDLHIASGFTATLTGGGTVTLNNSSANRIFAVSGSAGDTFTNVDNIIQGAGQIGVGQTTIDNQAAGTIIANQSAGLTIQAGSGGFSNEGTLRVTSGNTLNVVGPFTNFASGSGTLTGGTYQVQNGTFRFDNANIVNNAATIVMDGAASQIVNNQTGGDGLANFANNTASGSFTVQNGRNLTVAAPFSNAGAMTIGTNSTLTVPGTYTQTGGSTRLNTTVADSSAVLTATNVSLSGGTLSGNGTINGNVSNTGGTVSPGQSPGKIRINGSYTQSASGFLDIDLGGLTQGSQYDLLSLSGSAALGGTLDIDLVNGFMPADGDTFEVMTYGSFTGMFDAINGLDLGNGITLTPIYNPTDFVLQAHGVLAAPTPEPSTFAYLVTGVGALGLYRRRRKVARE